ncbi:MAG: hypothetical protein WAM63_02070 [Rhodomicrobium sp.]
MLHDNLLLAAATLAYERLGQRREGARGLVRHVREELCILQIGFFRNQAEHSHGSIVHGGHLHSQHGLNAI